MELINTFSRKIQTFEGIAHYQGLNQIAKRNNASLTRSDDIFNLFGDELKLMRLKLVSKIH